MMKQMKPKNHRMLSIAGLVLALLFFLPLAINVPVLDAEGVETLDLATYQNLTDVDDELLEKMVDTNLKPGISLDMAFNLEFGYEIDVEQIPPQHVVVDGDLRLESTEDFNALLDVTLNTNSNGDDVAFKYELFLVNHDNSPENMLMVAYTAIGADETEADTAMKYVQQETILRSDLEKWNPSSLATEDIKNFTTFKIVEDQGDTVDVVALISMEEINAFMTRATSFTVADESSTMYDLERANAMMKKLEAEFDVETFVLPIHMTLEKSSGQIKSVKYQADGIQELLTKVYAIEREEAEKFTSQGSPVTIDIVNVSFDVSNVEYGKTDRIILPEHVLEVLNDQRTTERTP